MEGGGSAETLHGGWLAARLLGSAEALVVELSRPTKEAGPLVGYRSRRRRRRRGSAEPCHGVLVGSWLRSDSGSRVRVVGLVVSQVAPGPREVLARAGTAMAAVAAAGVPVTRLVDTSSVAALSSELRRHGVDTKTPGVTGEERRRALEQRWTRYAMSTIPGFVPPPPAGGAARRQQQSLQSLVPPPPDEAPLVKAASAPQLRATARPAAPQPSRTAAPILAAPHEGSTVATALAPAPMEASFDCEHCGKSFKKAAHLVVHSRSHTRDILQQQQQQEEAEKEEPSEISRPRSRQSSLSSLPAPPPLQQTAPVQRRQGLVSAVRDDQRPQPEANSLWIEEFAKGLFSVSSKPGSVATPAGGALQRRNALDGPPAPLERRSTFSGVPTPTSSTALSAMRLGPAAAPAVPGRTRSMPSLPAPPHGPPAATVASVAAMGALAAATSRALAQQGADAARAEEAAATLRAEVMRMEGRKAEWLRLHLVDRKEVEVQEAEWELEQVRDELRRCVQHSGLFVDSSAGSRGGRVQRWAKEDLAEKLSRLEAAAAERLRRAEAAVHLQAERHPEFGADAQRLRAAELARVEQRAAQLRDASVRDALAANPVVLLHQTAVARGAAPLAIPVPAGDFRAIAQEALALHLKQGQQEAAEERYRAALRCGGSEDATVLGNFALFLSGVVSGGGGGSNSSNIGNDDDNSSNSNNNNNESSGAKKAHRKGVPHKPSARDEEADRMFRAAIRIDQGHANNLANYALFLKNNLRDFDRAEQYFERALRAAPDSAPLLGNYASFLYRARGDAHRADRIFKRALEADPQHVNNLVNYAHLLKKTARFEQAEGLYARALRIAPRSATLLSNYANLIAQTSDPNDTRPEALQRVRQAQELYLQALASDAEHHMARRNYMLFLRDFPLLRGPPVTRIADASAKEIGSPGSPSSPGSPGSPGSPSRALTPRRRNKSRAAYSPRPLSPSLDRVIESKELE